VEIRFPQEMIHVRLRGGSPEALATVVIGGLITAESGALCTLLGAVAANVHARYTWPIANSRERTFQAQSEIGCRFGGHRRGYSVRVRSAQNSVTE
jgi:hypothetical protein